MKTRYILLSLFIVPAVLFAKFLVPYDSTKPPGLVLPAAYEIAAHTLGSATNDFYCSQAGLSTEGRPMWYFTFCTTNTPPKIQTVWVYFDGTTRIPPGDLR
jgi:hypothetical protein